MYARKKHADSHKIALQVSARRKESYISPIPPLPATAYLSPMPTLPTTVPLVLLGKDGEKSDSSYDEHPSKKENFISSSPLMEESPLLNLGFQV